MPGGRFENCTKTIQPIFVGKWRFGPFIKFSNDPPDQKGQNHILGLSPSFYFIATFKQFLLSNHFLHFQRSIFSSQKANKLSYFQSSLRTLAIVNYWNGQCVVFCQIFVLSNISSVNLTFLFGKTSMYFEKKSLLLFLV